MNRSVPSASATWFCRPFRTGDEAGIVALLQNSFLSWPSVETDATAFEHLQWKLASHPLASQFTPVAESNGRIVGLRPFMVKEVVLAGKEALTYGAVDIAVHPDFRELGVYKDLAAVDYEGLDGRKTSDTFSFKLSYESHHEAILTTARTYEGKIRVQNGLAVLASSGSPPLNSSPGSNIALRSVSAFDERQDQFWRVAAHQFAFISARGMRFMNWRYADPRAAGFEILLAEDGRELLGYAVFGRSRGRIVIADMLVLPQRNDVAMSLTIRIVERAIANSAEERVECWLPECHPYQTVLKEAGFFRRRDGPVISCRPGITPAAGLDLLCNTNSAIHLTAGDTDLI